MIMPAVTKGRRLTNILGMTGTTTRCSSTHQRVLTAVNHWACPLLAASDLKDYAGGDERQKADEYSWYDWDYDPVLFNAPEGSYSSEPLGLPLARRVGGGVEQGLNGRGCDGGFVHKKFGLRSRWAAGRQCVSIS